jgi:hypothetical protein
MVEGAVSEGQGERVRLSKLNPVREPAACGQDARDFDEGGREVDRRYSATAFGCEIARRAPEPATNFEHVHAGSYARTFRMLARCYDTPTMQLVERPQIAMAGRLGIHPSGAEGIFDPLEYRPIAVIALNYRLDVGHADLPHHHCRPHRPGRIRFRFIE